MNDAALLGLPHWAVVLLERTETIMASVDELNAKIDELVGSIASAQARIQEDFDFLKAQIAAATPDLGPAMAKVDAAIQSLNAVDPVPENPAA